MGLSPVVFFIIVVNFLIIKYLQSISYGFYNLLLELYRFHENGINIFAVILYQIKLIRPSSLFGQDGSIVNFLDVIVGDIDNTSKGKLVTLQIETHYPKTRHSTNKYLQLFTNQNALIKYKHVSVFYFLIVVSFNPQFGIFHKSTEIR